MVNGLYHRLANDEDARVCTDISDYACRYVPANFVRIVGSSLLTKTGDALINPKTVLAWLVNFVGAPAFVLALLVPLRESGSMIPQLAIAAWVRRQPIRKWTWVLGSVLQGLAVAAIGASVFLFRGMAAGIALLVTLVVFSLARGLCSVSSKDVLGKTIPKTRRGRVNGIASGLSGVFVVLVGLGMYLGRPDDAGIAWMPGFLPHAMQEDYVKLVAAFRSCRILEEFAQDDPLRANELVQARAEAAYHMGILSHWVADAAQPLHTTIHHHGWIGDNPEGYTTEGRFHNYIDSGVVDAHGFSAATLVGELKIEPIEIADTGDPWNEICAHIQRSFDLVEPIYILERDGMLETDKGKVFLLERFADGAGTLAGLYQAAWEHSKINDSIISSYLRYEAPSPTQSEE